MDANRSISLFLRLLSLTVCISFVPQDPMTPPSSSALVERVIQVIATSAQIPADEINETTAIEDLDIDSLGFLGIVGELEDEFDVEIPNDRAFRITNLPELIACLEELIDDHASGSGEERPA